MNLAHTLMMNETFSQKKVQNFKTILYITFISIFVTGVSKKVISIDEIQLKEFEKHANNDQSFYISSISTHWLAVLYGSYIYADTWTTQLLL